MVSERKTYVEKFSSEDGVLILVVVEDGLRGQQVFLKEKIIVLILVVVEDGLREQKMQCDDH